MGILSEDIDVVTSKICAKAEVWIPESPITEYIYRASPQKLTYILKEILSQIPIDEISEEIIAKYCLQAVDLSYRRLFRFYRMGDPERSCTDPEVYEFKGKLTKYTKPIGFYIKFI